MHPDTPEQTVGKRAGVLRIKTTGWRPLYRSSYLFGTMAPDLWMRIKML
jgi:hypothetical protein